jgi:hypothetical protein
MGAASHCVPAWGNNWPGVCDSHAEFVYPVTPLQLAVAWVAAVLHWGGCGVVQLVGSVEHRLKINRQTV